MEKRVKKTFSTNKKAYMFISVIFYISNILHYSIIFDISGFRNYILHINKYLDPFIMLILIVTCFLSYGINSVYSFPFNTLLGKTKHCGLFMKIVTFALPGILLKYGLVQNKNCILNIVLLFVVGIDFIITYRCFVKVQNVSISKEIILTDINEDEYNVYQEHWSETLKLFVISSMVSGFITSKNMNLDLRIIISALLLMTVYNWLRFYIRYKSVIRNSLIVFLSLIWLIGVAIYSISDTFVLNKNTFSGIEYSALYLISVIILFSSINKINLEMIKYKYINNIGNNLLQIHK